MSGKVGLGRLSPRARSCSAIVRMPRWLVIKAWCLSVHTALLPAAGMRELNGGKIIRSKGLQIETNGMLERISASAFRS